MTIAASLSLCFSLRIFFDLMCLVKLNICQLLFVAQTAITLQSYFGCVCLHCGGICVYICSMLLSSRDGQLYIISAIFSLHSEPDPDFNANTNPNLNPSNYNLRIENSLKQIQLSVCMDRRYAWFM